MEKDREKPTLVSQNGDTISTEKLKKVSATEIIKAIQKGERLEIHNSLIEGDITLRHEEIKGEIVIQNTRFTGKLDFCFSTFNRTLNLENSTFSQPVFFIGATLQSDILLNGGHFHEKVNFSEAHINGVFYSKSTPGRITKFGEEVRFEGTEFNKRVEFHGTQFLQNAFFYMVRIRGTAEFPSVIFAQKASFLGGTFSRNTFFKPEPSKEEKNKVIPQFMGEVDFSNCLFEGSIDFIEVEFHGIANFIGIRANHSASFQGSMFHNHAQFHYSNFIGKASFRDAKFLNEAKEEELTSANFTSCRFEKTCNFNKSEFHGIFSFNTVRVDENAFFKQAKFLGPYEHCADFINSHIEGQAAFNEAIFEGGVSFFSASMNSDVIFDAANFSDFPGKIVNFSSIQIDGSLYLRNAVFHGEVNFGGLKATGDLELSGVEFKQKVSFENGDFKSINLGKEKKLTKEIFPKGVDMRGCTYQRLEPLPYWKLLVKQLNPYDRQPFTQLESIVRSTGNDHLADDIYFLREKTRAICIKERKAPFQNIDTFQRRYDLARDFAFRAMAGYGVRPHRFFYLTLLLVCIGTPIFHNEGAVVPLDIESPPPIQVNQLSWGDAAWVSLDLLLPISIQTGVRLQPSYKFWVGGKDREGKDLIGIRYVDIGTLYNLLGWILIPVVLAGLTGILKRP